MRPVARLNTTLSHYSVGVVAGGSDVHKTEQNYSTTSQS